MGILPANDASTPKQNSSTSSSYSNQRRRYFCRIPQKRGANITNLHVPFPRWAAERAAKASSSATSAGSMLKRKFAVRPSLTMNLYYSGRKLHQALRGEISQRVVPKTSIKTYVWERRSSFSFFFQYRKDGVKRNS